MKKKKKKANEMRALNQAETGEIRPLNEEQRVDDELLHYDNHLLNNESNNGERIVSASNSQALKQSTDKRHHHSHSHGHSHHHFYDGADGIDETAARSSSIISGSSKIKSNAWMVILGDGLHNFSDGLAIGISFANSLSAGLGTTIAIFFHELPHEIGDFALLRKSGVPLKHAILFNLFSSLLCFVGILLGLLISSISFISNWSFLFIAGVFLYISLVDMVHSLSLYSSSSIKLKFKKIFFCSIIPKLPELSNNDQSKFEFFLQNIGILVGVGEFSLSLY